MTADPAASPVLLRPRFVLRPSDSLAPTVQLNNYYGGIGKLPPVQRATAYQGKCAKTKAATINPPVWFGSSVRSIASTTHTDFTKAAAPVGFRYSYSCCALRPCSLLQPVAACCSLLQAFGAAFPGVRRATER